MTIIKEIAEQINNQSKNFEIGKLQEIRTKIKNFKKQPAKVIFHNKTIFDKENDSYAFHYGGRKELQYNVGIENDNIRHGVAFSLKRGRNLRDVTILYPKIQRFNEYLRLYTKEYSDMMVRYYDYGTKKWFMNHKAGIIDSNIAQREVFIFLGKFQKGKGVAMSGDYVTEVLRDFDRLLPLYIYVESESMIKPEMEEVQGLRFLAGCTVKKKATKVTKKEIVLDIDLRHNLLQEKLYDLLVKKYGEESVGTECLTVGGKKIDLVVNRKDGVIYYEIKTALTAKTSIRESLSQLLEYSYWPGGSEASKLVIISEASLDNEADQYLKTLRQKFSIPVYYEQVKIE